MTNGQRTVCYQALEVDTLREFALYSDTRDRALAELSVRLGLDLTFEEQPVDPPPYLMDEWIGEVNQPEARWRGREHFTIPVYLRRRSKR